ncbi:DNA repair protein RadC [Ramlibacter ginsenosidimutans]|uniref:DNA repair protein RadC n=2 Tax=Ramlibacter ginsenosidimutans TaxID=502333 RepID=A0A934TXD7_9BURK|nr:DNA repair protein RadC [Ramlibacter ginsenosidimutans]MBK6008650.1 DNA repair protein RadC [Ramlibacter ginsenosidimutans]
MTLLASEVRPRYRLLSAGPKALTDAELVAVLLRTGLPGRSVLSLARDLLDSFGGIAGLLYASVDEVADVRALGGETRRTELLAVLELARRAVGEQLSAREVFSSPDAVKQFLQLHLARVPHEVFAVMFLDAQNRLIELEVMFRGTLTQTSVYPREIVKRALHHESAAVVLAHNHPSGTVQPSRADEALTATLKQALSVIEVRVLDHVIVAPGTACSMAESGLI